MTILFAYAFGVLTLPTLFTLMVILKLRRPVGANLFMFGEALTRIAREYRDIADAQEGQQTYFACGVWLRGITKAELDKVRAAIEVDAPGAIRAGEWWDALPPRRRTLFVAMAAHASTPERASLKCMEELVRRFEEHGVATAEAVRIEVDEMPQEYRS